ncbi:MAG: ABC transporter permease [Eubacteriales bacterium]|nr:ABC transporter permease [Eubacteriales bacterium]
MFQKFKTDINKYRKYAVYSAKAQLKSEVANSYLNWLWWILEPFCYMLIYAFIFGVVFGGSEPYFPIFIFVGNTMWVFFQKTLSQSVKLVKQNKSTVSKVYLPKYILLITKILVNAFKMGICILIVIGMLVYYHVPMTWNVLYCIPLLMTLIVITFGVSCFLLHYGVYIEDLQNVVNIALRLLFYMTGIFWDIMKRLAPPYNTYVCRINPVAFLISSMRDCVIYGQTPHRKLLLLWFVIGIIISILGIRKIYKNENSYVKVI